VDPKQEEAHLIRWRMILGKLSEPESDPSISLDEELQGMDEVLEALYDSDREGGLGPSSPNINRWLGDIRKYFPSAVVEVVQKDALERLDLQQLLAEPEFVEMLEPNVDLVATILLLNKVLPARTRETARLIVQKLVRQIEKRLREPMREAVSGALNRARKNRHPKLNEIDWNRTILKNLKNYQPDLKTIIPEQLVGYGKKKGQLKHLHLLIDQSGSMAGSVVYAGILGSILASLPSIKTRLVAFDTNILDLTEQLEDPVELLFGTQLGGGTDIGQALQYARQHISRPSETILFLLSDLFEGGSTLRMLQNVAEIKASGVKIIALLALNDKGAPSYDQTIAAQLAQMDIPAFACTPDRFPELLAGAIEGRDLRRLNVKGLSIKN
jgi:Mg-chelatase subunit ChlD